MERVSLEIWLDMRTYYVWVSSFVVEGRWLT